MKESKLRSLRISADLVATKLGECCGMDGAIEDALNEFIDNTMEAEQADAKNAAYQWVKATLFVERGNITSQACELLNVLFGEDCMADFYERYNEEEKALAQDGLELIRKDARKTPGEYFGKDCPYTNSWLAQKQDLIKRTVKVMERKQRSGGDNDGAE